MEKERVDTIVISRTDSIGDVVLTLPLAGYLKKMYPGVKIIFLGTTYTKPILDLCEHVEEVLLWDKINQKPAEEQLKIFADLRADVIIHALPNREVASLAKSAGIKHRIGTAGRLAHFTTVNEKVYFSRKRSPLHEAQLNFMLLKPLEIKHIPDKQEISALYGFRNPPALKPSLLEKINLENTVILHPGSKGSAVEWGYSNYSQLAKLLSKKGYNVLVTGTETEGAAIRGYFDFFNKGITDLTGKLKLSELVSLIYYSGGLVAASTGPLHIAAAYGKAAVGLYSRRQPIHPGRWEPIGPKAQALVYEGNDAETTAKGMDDDVKNIKPQVVLDCLLKNL